MSAIIDIIKRYVFEIVCGAACLAGIVLAVLGLGAMDKVQEQMQGGLRLQGQIDNFLRDNNPINEKALEQQRRRIDQVQAEYERVMEFVSKLNAYEPLTATAFPESTTGQRTTFRNAYQQQTQAWLDQLNAGRVPTAIEVENEKDLLIAEEAEAEMLGEKDKGPKRDDRSIEERARVRAAQKKARSIYIYAGPESFQSSDISDDPGGAMYRTLPPEPEDMWYAQLEVWIQNEIVERIAAINNQAAETLEAQAKELREAGKTKEARKVEPWVGNLPVKDIISIQIGDGRDLYYLTKGEQQGSRGRDEQKERAYPPLNADEVFTGDTSTPLYELVQFTVKLVIDARDLPRVLAGLCKDNFNVPLNVTYQKTPPDPTMEGKIYGDQPTITVTIDFQTVFFSEFYLSMMPDEILKKLNKKRPEPDKEA